MDSIIAIRGQIATLGPFMLDVPVDDSAQTYRFCHPYGGEIQSLSVNLNAGIDTGTITFEVFRNGDEVGEPLIVYPRDGDCKTVPMDISFGPEERMYIRATSSGTLGTVYATVIAQITYNMNNVVEYSTEIGRTPMSNDYLYRLGGPETGTLFAGRFKSPEALVIPDDREDMKVFKLVFDNWYVHGTCAAIDAGSPGNCSYRAKLELYADGSAVTESATTFLGYYTDLTEEDLDIMFVNGWVFMAWQILNTETSIILRQWLRFQDSSTVIGPIENELTYTELRTLATNTGWDPGNAAEWTPSLISIRFEIGDSQAFVQYLRMYERSDFPANWEIEGISYDNDDDDDSAWGYWPLIWSAWGVNTSDESNNGNYLTYHGGGQFFQGARFFN